MAVSSPLSPISTTIKRPLTTTEVVDAVIPIDIRLEGNVSRGHRPRNPFNKRAPRDTTMRQRTAKHTFSKPGNIRKPKPSSVPSLAFGEVMAHPL